jgi:hypothetical protein
MGVNRKPPLRLNGVRVDKSLMGFRLFSNRSLLPKEKDRVSYSIVKETEHPRKERRQVARARTQLSSGKILDLNGCFLTECALRNKTANGVHLRLMREVSIPERIHFYDDSLCCLSVLLVIWRKQNEIGCRVLQARQAADFRLLARFKNPFYAMP